MGSVIAVDTISAELTYKSPQITNAVFYSTYGSWTTITTTALKSTSINCSSVNDNGTGDTTVSFTSVFNDTNYPVEASAADNTSVRAAGAAWLQNDTHTTSAFQVRAADDANNVIDSGDVTIAIAGYVDPDSTESVTAGALVLSAPEPITLSTDSLTETFLGTGDFGNGDTWTAAPLGTADPERYIVVAFSFLQNSSGTAVFDTLTINGVTATWDITVASLPAADGNAIIGIGHAKVPDGTTGDIVFGITGTATEVTAAGAWRVISTNIGASVLQVIDTLSQEDSAPTDGTMLDAADLSSWNDGLVFVSGLAHNGLTWSPVAAGLNEDWEFDTNTNEWFVGYSDATDGTDKDVEILDADATADEIVAVAITYGP